MYKNNLIKNIHNTLSQYNMDSKACNYLTEDFSTTLTHSTLTQYIAQLNHFFTVMLLGSCGLYC